MKPSKIEIVLKNLLSSKWPTFIWGPPGVGKSSVVQKVAKDNKLALLDIRASLLDPTDLRGIPTVEDGKAHWCPPSFLPSDPKSKGIIFFDELNAAPPLVQASLYQLTLDRKVGEYILPDGWRIIAAGNRAEDASVTFRMPAALANRFIHLDFEVSFDDWRAWAIANQIHPYVIGFLSLRGEALLHNMSDVERGFPSPRSWEMVSDILKNTKELPEIKDVVLGAIGEAASIEFFGYLDNAISEETIQKIIKSPKDTKLPKALGDQYAVIAYFSSHTKDKQVQEAAGVLLARLKPELAILLLRNILSQQPKFALNSEVKKFIKEHKEVIQ